MSPVFRVLPFILYLPFSSTSTELGEKLIKVSQAYMGRPYKFDPLGEGPGSLHDEDPIVNFETFDCMTYVETVLAMTKTNTEKEFFDLFTRIRYQNGKVDFFSRNHFVETKWLKNIHQLRILEEFTDQMGFNTKTIKGEIDNQGWLKKLKHRPTKFGIQKESDYIKNHSIVDLKPQTFSIMYVPKELLSPDKVFFKNSIREGLVVFYIGIPSKKNQKALGTNSAIFHSGILIEKKDQLFVRNATSEKRKRKIVDTPLSEIVKKKFDGVKLLGFNFQKLKE